MEVFLIQTLNSIPKATRNTKLKESCATSLDLLKKHGIIKSNDNSKLQTLEKVMNKILFTLKLACDSHSPKATTDALYCMQKLLEYGSIPSFIRDLENPEQKLIDKMVDIICHCVEIFDDNVHLQIIKCSLTIINLSASDVISSNSFMKAYISCFTIYLITKTPSNQALSYAILQQMTTLIFQRYEKVSSDSKLLKHGNDINAHHQEVVNSARDIVMDIILYAISFKKFKINHEIGHPENENIKIKVSRPITHSYRECLIIFKTLCQYSMNELHFAAAHDSIDIKRKVLSLELLQTIIENAGPALRDTIHFGEAIKKDLYISLLVNGVSPLSKVFRISLNIFNGLITNFKELLRNEIGGFFSKIILCILASSSSTPIQKKNVLKLVLNLCKQSPHLVDIFLNFDCQLESDDLFERMVNELSSIAKGTINETSIYFMQEVTTKVLALNCLVTVIKTLATWSVELIDSPIHKEEHQEKENKENNQIIIESNEIHELKNGKQSNEIGISMFSHNPTNAINYLIENKVIISSNSKDIAHFLYSQVDLDHKMKGEYLGNHSNNDVKLILYAYIDLHRFKGLRIDDAMRSFFERIRLPKELQKIDVIIEKFGEKYYNDNKDTEEFLFNSADAAYLLAYHLILLNNDLHLHNLRVNINRNSWVKSNVGLNDGKDFPDYFLNAIYDSLQQDEIHMLDDCDHISQSNANNNVSNYYNTNNSNNHIEISEKLIIKESKLSIKSPSEFITEIIEDKSIHSKYLQYVKPMFEISWCPMLASFSVMFELNEALFDKEISSLCLEGFKAAVQVSSIFYMDVERNAFITSLSQFAQLLTLRESKNIGAYKLIIDISLEIGNYLQDSWGPVLSCVSQLKKYQLLSKTSVEPPVKFRPKSERRWSEKITLLPSSSGNSNNILAAIKQAEEKRKLSIISNIDMDKVDKIFIYSKYLNNTAIVDFIRHLCAVSDMEVNSNEARIFSLQKLIEVTYYNMDRIRFVWSQIWELLADHLIKVGANENLNVSYFAIDSLLKLSLKFLDKKELSHFHFQNDFLRPFAEIFQANQFEIIKELIVNCLFQIIVEKGENIKSGWKSIFVVLNFAAQQHSEKLVKNSFEAMENIVSFNFQSISELFFVDCAYCLFHFASSAYFPETSKRAVDLLYISISEYHHLQIHKLSNINNKNNDNNNHENNGNIDNNIEINNKEIKEIKYTTNERDIQQWNGNLQHFTNLIHHSQIEVRSSALSHLFKTLQEFGDSFSNELWELIFDQILCSIFSFIDREQNEIPNQSQNSINNNIKTQEWINTTSLSVFDCFIDLFQNNRFEIRFLLLQQFLILLTKCILHSNDILANISANSFVRFIKLIASDWSPSLEIWNIICENIYFICVNNMPIELFSIGDQEKIINDNINYTIQLSSENPLNFIEDLPIDIITKYHTNNYDNIDANSIVNINDKITDIIKNNLKVVKGNEDNNIIEKSNNNSLFIDKLKSNIKRKKNYDIKVISGRCNVGLTIIEGIRNIILENFSILEISQFIQFFYSLKFAHNFAFQSNNRAATWKATSKSGIMQLVMQIECLSMNVLIELLFKLYDSEANSELFAEPIITKYAKYILEEYHNIHLNMSSLPSLTYIECKSPVIIQLLQEFSALPDEKFSKHVPWLYALIANISIVNKKEIRVLSRDLFLRFRRSRLLKYA